MEAYVKDIPDKFKYTYIDKYPEEVNERSVLLAPLTPSYYPHFETKVNPFFLIIKNMIRSRFLSYKGDELHPKKSLRIEDKKKEFCQNAVDFAINFIELMYSH